MPHIRIEPMKELETLTQRIRKFAEEFPETISFEIGKGFEPKVDVIHNDKTITVFVELAGVTKQDVNVSLKESILCVSGTKPIPYEADKVNLTKIERGYGAFQRSIELPAEIDSTSIHASMTNGVLILTLNKKSLKQEQEINIDIH